MKQPDYPEEDGRTVPFQAEKKASPGRRESESRLQYSDLPAGPPQAGPGRNIALGITCLVLAAIGLWLGLYYAGAAVVRTLVASLGAFGLLMLLNGCGVLRQRNGTFLAMGLVALFGAAIPFIEGAFRKLDRVARANLGGEVEERRVSKELPPPVTRETAPPAPTAADLPEPETPTLAADTARTPGKPVADDGPPRELLLQPPAANAGKVVRLKDDVKVPLDGRMTILRAGTLAPFKSLEDGKVTFLVNGSEVSIDSELVVFTGTTQEKPADITALAQREARRRYPKIGELDSRENLLFVTRAKEIAQDKEMSTVFFGDPKWPLVLAEQIAEQEGWTRADITEEGIPANELPAVSKTPSDPAGPAADLPSEKPPRQESPGVPPR